MEALKNFCDHCIKMAKEAPADAKLYMHQAYGAVDFYIWTHEGDVNRVAIMWEKYIEKFANIMLGK